MQLILNPTTHDLPNRRVMATYCWTTSLGLFALLGRDAFGVVVLGRVAAACAGVAPAGAGMLTLTVALPFMAAALKMLSMKLCTNCGC